MKCHESTESSTVGLWQGYPTTSNSTRGKAVTRPNHLPIYLPTYNPSSYHPRTFGLVQDVVEMARVVVRDPSEGECYLSIYLSIYPSIYPSTYLTVYPPTTPPTRIHTYPPIYPSTYPRTFGLV